MTPAAIHYFLKTECLAGGGIALSRSRHQKIGSHYRTVQPMHLARAPNAADNADIRSVDFGEDFADEKFWQSKRIRRTGRRVVHSQLRHHSLSGKSLVSKSRVSREEYAVSGCRHKTQCNHADHYFVSVQTRVFHTRSDFGTRLCTGA